MKLAALTALTVAALTPLGSAQNLVLCRLSGKGFQPRERVAITYRVTFLAQQGQGGKHPERVYKRTGVTDGHGGLMRPALGFTVVPDHESYRLSVSVRGGSRDSATIAYTATAQ